MRAGRAHDIDPPRSLSETAEASGTRLSQEDALQSPRRGAPGVRGCSSRGLRVPLAGGRKASASHGCDVSLVRYGLSGVLTAGILPRAPRWPPPPPTATSDACYRERCSVRRGPAAALWGGPEPRNPPGVAVQTQPGDGSRGRQREGREPRIRRGPPRADQRSFRRRKPAEGVSF